MSLYTYKDTFKSILFTIVNPIGKIGATLFGAYRSLLVHCAMQGFCPGLRSTGIGLLSPWLSHSTSSRDNSWRWPLYIREGSFKREDMVLASCSRGCR